MGGLEELAVEGALRGGDGAHLGVVRASAEGPGVHLRVRPDGAVDGLVEHHLLLPEHLPGEALGSKQQRTGAQLDRNRASAPCPERKTWIILFGSLIGSH